MRRDLSSVDSLDGICASTGAPSTDDDTISLYSNFDCGTKAQKLETRIGINHFNRYTCCTVFGLLCCLNLLLTSLSTIRCNFLHNLNRREEGGKFLKKLWCCVGR